MLLRAAFSTKGSRPRPGAASTGYARLNQTAVALGTYWPLGAKWLVGGLVSTGQARPDALFRGDGGALGGVGWAKADPHAIDFTIAPP